MTAGLVFEAVPSFLTEIVSKPFLDLAIKNNYNKITKKRR